MSNKIIAYKVFNKNWECLDYNFKDKNNNVLNTIHTIKGKLILCENGFHFCRKLANCFSYYRFDNNNKVAKIEVLGDIIGSEEDKEGDDEQQRHHHHACPQPLGVRFDIPGQQHRLVACGYLHYAGAFVAAPLEFFRWMQNRECDAVPDPTLARPTRLAT